MRYLITSAIATIAVILTGCSTDAQRMQKSLDTQTLTELNALLAREPFVNAWSRGTFAAVDRCHLEFVEVWSQSAAQRRDFAAATNRTVIPLDERLDRVEFNPEHDVRRGNRIERWGDAINFYFAGEGVLKRIDVVHNGSNAKEVVELTLKVSGISVAQPYRLEDIQPAMDKLKRLQLLCRSSHQWRS